MGAGGPGQVPRRQPRSARCYHLRPRPGAAVQGVATTRGGARRVAGTGDERGESGGSCRPCRPCPACPRAGGPWTARAGLTGPARGSTTPLASRGAGDSDARRQGWARTGTGAPRSTVVAGRTIAAPRAASDRRCHAAARRARRRGVRASGVVEPARRGGGRDARSMATRAPRWRAGRAVHGHPGAAPAGDVLRAPGRRRPGGCRRGRARRRWRRNRRRRTAPAPRPTGRGRVRPRACRRRRAVPARRRR